MGALLFGRFSTPILAQAAPVVIRDEHFAASNWAMVVVEATMGASAEAAQLTIGGNPGSYRAMTYTLPTPPQLELTRITVVHLYTATPYLPTRQGAIDHVDFRQDARMLSLPWDQAFTTTQAALRQGGRIFQSTHFVRTVGTTTWESSALLELKADAFVASDGSGDHPDFSETGGPIEFGFVRLNSRLADQPPVPPGDLIYSHAIDNWSITVAQAANAVADLVVAPTTPSGKSYVNFESTTDLFFLGTPTVGLSITNRGPATATAVTVDLTFLVPSHYAQSTTLTNLTCDAAGLACTVGDVSADGAVNVAAFRTYRPTRGHGAYHGSAFFQAIVQSTSTDPTPGDASYSHTYELFYCDDSDSFVCPIQTLFCLENFEDLRQRPVPSTISPAARIKAAADIVIDLPIYYPLRDQVMAPRLGGQRLIAHYATHGPEITALLNTSDTLRTAAVATIVLWEPNFVSLLSGDGTATISQAQVDALSALLDALASAGSGALQATIATELATLGDLNDYVGLSMTTAQASVLGDLDPARATIYLPIVHTTRQ